MSQTYKSALQEDLMQETLTLKLNVLLWKNMYP